MIWRRVLRMVSVILLFFQAKRVKTGDGFFFALMMTFGIWFAGFFYSLIRQDFKTQQFEPIAVFGGFLWATGNMCVVPILQTLGLSIGMLIWGSAALIAGWATARFGWFINEQAVANSGLNFLGVGLCLLALVMYVFVKSDAGEGSSSSSSSHSKLSSTSAHLVAGNYVDIADSVSHRVLHFPVEQELGHIQQPQESEPSAAGMFDSFSTASQRLIGVSLSVFSGLCYGTNFLPPQYLVDHHSEGHSDDLTTYVLSHFTGILATTFLYFMVYCMFKRGEPVLNKHAVLPAALSGSIWAVAQVSAFYASKNLDQVIAFPIVSSGPGLVGALWGIFVFREIRGAKNLAFVGLAFAITIAGVLCIALSH